MRNEFLSFSPPALSDLEVEEVSAILKQGQWLTSGPKVKAFEEEFRKTVNAPAALALNSCTAGLHLAMMVHGIGPGDEVVTTPLTFCATANVVEHVGGKVVFADIEPDTLLIDPVEIHKRLTKKTKMILPVHYAGQPCDMAAINAMGPLVVEDAAHCMPSKIAGQWIGDSKNLCAFSFYATKNMTSGEGGMLTGEASLLHEAKRLGLHGMSHDAWNRFSKGGNFDYDVPSPGFKYNMTDILAGIGLVQLRRLGELYERRMSIVRFYDENFKGSAFLRTPRVKADRQSSHHLYVILLELERLKIDRLQFVQELAARNIGCSVHYKPVHMMSYYAKKYGLRPQDHPNSLDAYQRMVSLPLSSKMTISDAQDVVDAVQEIFKKFSR